jgi:DNA-directed RNA polymerase subunit RPC12/RpoP
VTQADQEIICKDCRTKFVFTVRDQEFFAKMNFTPPVRCKPCRDKRKAEKNSGGGMNAPYRPQGASPSEPIREYRSGGPQVASFRENPPTEFRNPKNDGNRRRRGGGRNWRDSGDADW